MMEKEDFVFNLELPAQSKRLLSSLQNREMTLDEFMVECAYWALKDGFDDLRPRPLPTKTGKVLEIEGFDMDTKAKFDYAKCYEKFPEVKKYYADRMTIINKNKSDLEWLEKIKGYIPEGDVSAREKIEQRILKFKYFGN
jgi:hypothetical protein